MTQDPFAEILWAETARSVMKKTTLRLFGVTLWLGWAVVAGITVRPEAFAAAPWAALHLVAGTIVWLVLRRQLRRGVTKPTWALWSLCFLDFPLLYLGFRAVAKASEEPEASVVFLIGVLGVVIVGSASTVWRRHTITFVVLSTAGVIALLVETGSHLGWLLAALVVFAAATLIARDTGFRILFVARDWAAEKTQRTRLGRYFSPVVVEAILRGGSEAIAPVHQEITLLFADIRSFTAISEKMKGADVVVMLNDYLERMAAIIFDHGGTLDKIMGDGIMAYFGAPLPSNTHAGDAVRCAVAMQEAVAQMDAELKVGIGIHTGRALVGDIGPPGARDYTAIGDAVNLASRVESLTKERDANILVTEPTREQAGDEFEWRDLGSVVVRGRTSDVTLYSPLSDLPA